MIHQGAKGWEDAVSGDDLPGKSLAEPHEIRQGMIKGTRALNNLNYDFDVVHSVCAAQDISGIQKCRRSLKH